MFILCSDVRIPKNKQGMEGVVAHIRNTENHEKKYGQDDQGLFCRHCKGRVALYRVKHRVIRKRGRNVLEEDYTFAARCPNCEPKPPEDGEDLHA